MPKQEINFKLPTYDEKEDYVLNEVSSLFSVFNSSAIKMTNMDALNVTFKFDAEPEVFSQLDTLSDLGYTKTDSKVCSIYHKFDDDTAVASNVSFDKDRNAVIISVNM